MQTTEYWTNKVQEKFGWTPNDLEQECVKYTSQLELIDHYKRGNIQRQFHNNYSIGVAAIVVWIDV
jgi:hypothetical protein